jgi:hypothetical protein
MLLLPGSDTSALSRPPERASDIAPWPSSRSRQAGAMRKRKDVCKLNRLRRSAKRTEGLVVISPHPLHVLNLRYKAVVQCIFPAMLTLFGRSLE